MLNQGSSIFVSGSSKKMPNDVKNAFIDVIVKYGEKGKEEAENFVQIMKKQKKYVVEAWS